jgi:hypothetical protein
MAYISKDSTDSLHEKLDEICKKLEELEPRQSQKDNDAS